MNLIDTLNWRYTTKRMTGVEIPQEKVNRILNAINLSASSLGLQPYKILVIKNKNLKQELLHAANNQHQIIE
jgi:nitroreductase/dihydropteridine reductase